MPNQSHSLTKATAVALAVWCLTGVLPGARQDLSAGEQELVCFGKLDAASRERLDRLARQTPQGASTLRRQAQTYADTSAFLLSRVTLSPEEEARWADEEYNRLLNRYQVQAAPAEIQELVRQLEDHLTENLKRGTSRFEVFLVGDSSRTSFTLGGSRIYLSRKYFEQLHADANTDRERLAFVLAHEMGHVCRGHVRRRYQSQWLIEQSDRVIDEKSDTLTGASVNKLFVRGVDGCLRFLYSLEEDLQADLFALHLCRNAGIESDMLLDPLRERMIAAAGGTLSGVETHEPGRESRRLRAVLFEQSGDVPGGDYGLFLFDPETQQFQRAGDAVVAADARVVVFLHGMESRPERFREMAMAVASEGTQLLAFRYPNDGSLALAGRFLTKELQRVCPGVEHLDFVCHSAGGLVFRWYAEIEGGPFHQAILIGTPHGGSSLARLRNFFDFIHFIKDFTFDEASLLEQILWDTEGQIGFDLSPGSLFLSYLDSESDETLRDRYTIIRGRALKRRYALALRGSVKTARIVLRSQLEKVDLKPVWREVMQDRIAKLDVPPEIIAGDLAVTLESAVLEGVERIETVSANHVRLVNHETTVEIVREILSSE